MKTKPGIERITKQELTATKTWLEGRQATHVKACQQCSQAGKEHRKKCDTWWRLARKLHTIRRTLRHMNNPNDPNQDTLPGMEV